MRHQAWKKLCACVLSVGLFVTQLPVAPVSADEKTENAPLTKQETLKKEVENHHLQGTLGEWIDRSWLVGDDKGKVMADQAITRAEFVSLVNRAKGFKTPAPDMSRFTDVHPADWFYDEMSRAVQADYIKGVSATELAPNAPVTAEQIIAVAMRLAPKAPGQNTAQKVNIKGASDWAQQTLQEAVAAGYFAPSDRLSASLNGPATRAESILWLDRVFQNRRVVSAPGTYAFGEVDRLTVDAPDVQLKDTTVANEFEITDKAERLKMSNVKTKGKVKVDQGVKPSLDGKPYPSPGPVLGGGGGSSSGKTKTEAEKYKKTPHTLTVKVGAEITVDDVKGALPDLPKKAVVSIKTPANTSEVGDRTLVAHLVFGDNSEKDVNVPVKVEAKDKTQAESYTETPQTITVKVGDAIDVNQVKGALPNLPANTTVSIKTPANTAEVGDRTLVAHLVFADASEKDVNVPVKVEAKDKTQAENYTETPQTITVKVGDAIDVNQVKGALPNLPANTTVSIKTPANTAEVGDRTLVAHLVFADASEKDMNVPVKVEAKEPAGDLYPFIRAEEAKKLDTDGVYADGEYFGDAPGYHQHRAIPVQVTISGGKITNIVALIPENTIDDGLPYARQFRKTRNLIVKDQRPNYWGTYYASFFGAVNRIFALANESGGTTEAYKSAYKKVLGENAPEFKANVNNLNDTQKAVFDDVKTVMSQLGYEEDISSSATYTAAGSAKAIRAAVLKSQKSIPFRGIEVSGQIKTKYNVGDSLDLSGLTVTLKNKDGSSTKLNAKQLAEHGLAIKDFKNDQTVEEGTVMDKKFLGASVTGGLALYLYHEASQNVIPLQKIIFGTPSNDLMPHMLRVRVAGTEEWLEGELISGNEFNQKAVFSQADADKIKGKDLEFMVSGKSASDKIISFKLTRDEQGPVTFNTGTEYNGELNPADLFHEGVYYKFYRTWYFQFYTEDKLTQADKYRLKPKVITVKKGTQPSLEQVTAAIPELPEGTNVSIAKAPNTSNIGWTKMTVTLKFKDKSYKSFFVDVHVVDGLLADQYNDAPNAIQVAENATVTEEQVKAALVNLPEDTKVSIKTPVDTTTSGHKTLVAHLVFSDGSEKDVNVPVQVGEAGKTMADKYQETATTITVKEKAIITADQVKAALPNLPEGTKVTIKTPADTTTEGNKTLVAHLVFSDNSEKDMDVPVKVEKEATPTMADQYTQTPTTITVKVNAAITADQVKAALPNLPEGTKVTIKTPADTTTEGNKTLVAHLVFSDNSEKDMDVPVKVEKEGTPTMADEYNREPHKIHVKQHREVNEDQVQGAFVHLNDEGENINEDIIKNVTIKTQPNTETIGETTMVATVVFEDDSQKDMTIQVIVEAAGEVVEGKYKMEPFELIKNADAGKTYPDGDYYGTASGFYYQDKVIALKVTVKDNKITAIEPDGSIKQIDDALYRRGYRGMKKLILDTQKPYYFGLQMKHYPIIYHGIINEAVLRGASRQDFTDVAREWMGSEIPSFNPYTDSPYGGTAINHYRNGVRQQIRMKWAQMGYDVAKKGLYPELDDPNLISGATSTAAGTAAAVINALDKADPAVDFVRMEVMDGYKRNYLFGESLDLSTLKIKLLKKDGTEEIVTHDQFKARGFKLYDPESNKEYEHGFFFAEQPEQTQLSLMIKHEPTNTIRRLDAIIATKEKKYVTIESVRIGAEGVDQWYDASGYNTNTFRNEVTISPEAAQALTGKKLKYQVSMIHGDVKFVIEPKVNEGYQTIGKFDTDKEFAFIVSKDLLLHDGTQYLFKFKDNYMKIKVAPEAGGNAVEAPQPEASATEGDAAEEPEGLVESVSEPVAESAFE